MVSTFGEVVYESSRAFADDEEEESQNQTGLSFEIEHTSAGQTLLKNGSTDAVPKDLVFSTFVGKVALGLGDNLVSNDKGYELLAEVYMVGQGENVVDMYLNRPKKKPIARLYQGIKDKSIFALCNTHGVPRYLANEVVETMESYMNICSRLYVFHSDTMAYYQSDESCEGKVFYVASSTYPKGDLPSASFSLTPPNVIGGVSAAVLTYGEMHDKPSLLLATYGETETVDSISLQPFSKVIKKNPHLSKMFVGLDVIAGKSFKSNVNPVAISNLYI